MNRIGLDPGIYTNVFPVVLPDQRVRVMTAARKNYQDLRSLRERIGASAWDARVYAAGSTVYGYGPDMKQLVVEGFVEQQVLLMENPQFAARLILEGVADAAKADGYEMRFDRWRATLFRPEPQGVAAEGRVRVFLGYELRAIYWGETSLRSFGLVVDVAWAVRDQTGERLDPNRLAEYGAVVEVGRIQGEFLPGTSKINTEVARQRFLEQILPFVQHHAEFALPCGRNARLFAEPVRVILGGREG